MKPATQKYKEPMPAEKPAWQMTVDEFVDNPPSYAWFKWFGWAEGRHYCLDSKAWARLTGYPCCIQKAIRDGHMADPNPTSPTSQIEA